MAIEAIYEHPEDYDLEVTSREVQDLRFWRALLLRERPARVLEIGSGTGRLSLPLAYMGATHGFTVTGLELEPLMIRRAEIHGARERGRLGETLRYIQGDVRSVDLPGQYDVILFPYGAAHHLVSIDDQFAAWRNVRRCLSPGGLFALDLEAPDFLSLARALNGTRIRRDLDVRGQDGRRLARTVTSHYERLTQLATHAFKYHVCGPDGGRGRYASDFAMHVYFPREVELLCRGTGFRVEQVLGSYSWAPFDNQSEVMITLARAAA